MAWLGTSAFKWALERPHNVPTTPTPACQRRDRQRHLRAPQPAQGAITGANAKPIFIQANGSLERDYWCRHKSCTPVAGAGAAHYHGTTLICWFHCFTVFLGATIGSFFCNHAMSTRNHSMKHPDCLWLTRTGKQCKPVCMEIKCRLIALLRYTCCDITDKGVVRSIARLPDPSVHPSRGLNHRLLRVCSRALSCHLWDSLLCVWVSLSSIHLLYIHVEVGIAFSEIQRRTKSKPKSSGLDLSS